MQKLWQEYKWIPNTVLGSAIFAAGFAFFLQPNDLSPGGISGLALLLVELTGFGSVGLISILMNLPLFILGGLKIGRRFFVGSLIGMVLSSMLIDGFAAMDLPAADPLIAIVYGGVVCGIGLGIVFINGTSTGGSDILVRLLKLRYRNVPIGQISLTFDAVVVLLTGLVFRDLNKALYTGITVYLCGKMVDAVVYRFDYSKVALIISKEYEVIAKEIGNKLDRGDDELGAHLDGQLALIQVDDGAGTHQNVGAVLGNSLDTLGSAGGAEGDLHGINTTGGHGLGGGDGVLDLVQNDNGDDDGVCESFHYSHD